MKNNVVIFIFILGLILACSDNNNETEPTDKPSSLIEIKIGSQIWSANNLDVSTFQNGDRIPETKTAEEWIAVGDAGKPAWCYFNNDIENGKKYGKLYNWHAVHDPRKLAPLGWYIPSITEWRTLTDFLENNGYGYKEKGNIAKSMAAASGWKVITTTIGAIGNNQETNNSSGFTALPGGSRIDDGRFYQIGSSACWWSSSLYFDTNDASGVGFNYYDKYLLRNHNNQNLGFSVRCLKN